ncbi:ABC transporter permease [Candidatus Altiarchaeota archaeon]
MRLRDISFGNLRRRKGRMIFLVIGMMMGVATIVTLSTITTALEADVKHKLDEFGANIMVVPRSNTLSMSYGGISIPGAHYDVEEINEDQAQKIYDIENSENIASISPKLLGALKINGDSVLVVGADLASEIKLKKWWKFTNDSEVTLVRRIEPSPIDPTVNTTVTVIEGLTDQHLILGSRLSAKIGKKAGDELVLSNQSFKIKAVLTETGSQDDSIIFMNLAVAQELLGKEGKITLIEVAAICSACPAEEIARQINEKIPAGQATPIKQVVESRMTTIRQLSKFGLTVGVIVLAIGSLIVFTTMTSQVKERTREIGILRAIGFRRSHIVKIILIEAILLSSMAGILGYGAGSAAAQIIGPTVADIQSGLTTDPKIAALAIGLSLLVGVSASIPPALKAAKIDPAEALRQI